MYYSINYEIIQAAKCPVCPKTVTHILDLPGHLKAHHEGVVRGRARAVLCMGCGIWLK